MLSDIVIFCLVLYKTDDDGSFFPLIASKLQRLQRHN